jgi:hypothetical protein
MSMSTHIIGFKPPDDTWKKMKTVWDACQAAKIPVPGKVEEFFNYIPPDNCGVEIELEKHPCCKKYTDKAQEGFEITIVNLPKDIKIIRFYNSW